MREEKTDKKKNSEREARNEGKHEVRPREGKVESDTDRQTERGGLGGCSVADGEAPGLVAGPSTCDLQEAEGHRCLTQHRHRKRALAQERNTIQGFHEATARLGARSAKILKQPGIFQKMRLSVFPLYAVRFDTLDDYMKMMRMFSSRPP